SLFVNALSRERVNEQLKLMGRAHGGPLSETLAREICQRSGSAALLHGSIANLGKQYVLGLSAVDCASGDFIATDQAEADAAEKVLAALEISTARIRPK